ncbi:MAG TPA: serine/threonine-protein kinase [Tepidisphaeraceae bacterium]|jgi:serine/threonine protein kinase|nr:serine/threonine-protein kinase [Tepidisphaeraceae bacterium]
MGQDDITARQPDAQVASPPVASQDASAKRIGPICLIRLIGKGGMGEVWLGKHELLGIEVALKVLSTGGIDSADPAFIDFIQGAKVAASLIHPGLNKVHHADICDGIPHLVLEYLDGPNLGELIVRHGRLDLPVVRAVVEAVCAAVAHLHQHDRVHRDIKPSNIVLTSDGRIVVTDFGLACATPALSLRQKIGVVAGTPAYMAPETFDGVASARSDVYAIGMTAYFLLTGQNAFGGAFDELRNHHKSTPLDVEPLRGAGVPDGVTDAIVRATSKDVLFRPKTARHVLEVFRRAFDEAGIQAAPRDAMVALLAGPISPRVDAPLRDPAAPSQTAETVSHLAALKREFRDSIQPSKSVAAAPARPVNPVFATQRKAEKRRIRIAYWIATVAGACASGGMVLLIDRNGARLEQWLSTHVAHAKVVMTPGPGNSVTFSRQLPIWEHLVLALMPLGSLVLAGVVFTILLYKTLRGKPLPADSENTRCGWCQHELRGITEPICSECGHRIGDRGPDEEGLVPLNRRPSRRFMIIVLLPVAFLLTTALARFAMKAVELLLFRRLSSLLLENILGFASLFFGAAAVVLLYEASLRLTMTHSGRAWCRGCKAELRDLAKPVCPACGLEI